MSSLSSPETKDENSKYLSQITQALYSTIAHIISGKKKKKKKTTDNRAAGPAHSLTAAESDS